MVQSSLTEFYSVNCVLISSTGFYWVLLASIVVFGFFKVLPGFTGIYLVLPSFAIFDSISQGLSGFT